MFTGVERAIQTTLGGQNPGQRSDWMEVEGAWVLYPPSNRAPEAVVHFLGGAFVGAAPQISYRLFLEALSNRNILVGAREHPPTHAVLQEQGPHRSTSRARPPPPHAPPGDCHALQHQLRPPAHRGRGAVQV